MTQSAACRRGSEGGRDEEEEKVSRTLGIAAGEVDSGILCYGPFQNSLKIS